VKRNIRLNITTEGQTEFRFVKDVLYNHLQPFGIFCGQRSVLTSKEYKKRGGMTTYTNAKKDILQWLKQENSDDRIFTTMFDFYALPKDFPDYAKVQKLTDPYDKVNCIEKAFAEDINDKRFIPYIQLHEFEALIFSDLDILLLEYEGRTKEVQTLKNLLSQSPYNNNPELINEKKETSPSHRIIGQIPEYQKANSGSLLTDLISIDTLRKRCRHFNEWLTKLEKL
jgi:hypothetical protein